MKIFEKINTFGSNKYIINKCIENQNYKEKIFSYYKISNQNFLYDENYDFCQIEKDILDGYYIDPEELANDICSLASFEWISFKINQLGQSINNTNTNYDSSSNGDIGIISYSPGYYTPNSPLNEETNKKSDCSSTGLWCQLLINKMKDYNTGELIIDDKNVTDCSSTGLWTQLLINKMKNYNTGELILENEICNLSSGMWCNKYFQNLKNSICNLSSGMWCNKYFQNLKNSICNLSSGMWCNKYLYKLVK